MNLFLFVGRCEWELQRRLEGGGVAVGRGGSGGEGAAGRSCNASCWSCQGGRCGYAISMLLLLLLEVGKSGGGSSRRRNSASDEERMRVEEVQSKSYKIHLIL